MTDDEIIAVVQAHKEGKQIQARVLESSPSYCFGLDGKWMMLNVGVWDFANVEYRIAPEPRKPREWLAFVTLAGGISSNCPINAESQYESVKVREVIEPSRDQRTWFAEFPLDGCVGQIFTDPRQLTKGGKLVRVMEILE